MHLFERDEPSTRWISVVFLQGDEAEELLDLIDREGPISAIYRLSDHDDGDATVEAALEAGYVYDKVPAGSTDHTIEPFGSPYALTYSDTFGYVSLLRRYEPAPEPSRAVHAPFEPLADPATNALRAPTVPSGARSRASHAVAL
ncbi:hypothetical protein GE115_02785 [Agromyces sp. CFH 90414]|uniref:Uncharacterized protein n=1 Tax=Agromyces agglutinans TaxID=2662258 RepID=A0A6I2F9W7_9MICO|nr:hypothetical protein [Agromyces agglutinans]MRG58803.1 hypothetical protein [Agromyces agglutinans]